MALTTCLAPQAWLKLRTRLRDCPCPRLCMTRAVSEQTTLANVGTESAMLAGMPNHSLRSLLCPLLLMAACGESSNTETTDASAPDALQRQTIFGGERSTELRVPDNYDPDVATPLLVVLHGYSITGAIQASYTALDRLVASEGILSKA